MFKLFKKIFFFIAYHFYAKPIINRVDNVTLLGFTLEIPPGVFHPKLYFSSLFFGEFLQTIDFTGQRVLDIGSGSGILSLVAASKGANVTAIDINATAVKTTSENARSNNLQHAITSIQSDLFSNLSLEQKFDFIVVNPPFYKKKPVSVADQAWNAGGEYQYFYQFTKHVSDYLSPAGKIYMILSTDGDVKPTLDILGKGGLKYREVASKNVLFERLIVYEMA